MSRHRPTSGRLTVEEGNLRFQLGSSQWQLSVPEIAVVGEFTTEGGPFADDYFIAFVARDCMVYVASFYADGRDQALAALGAHFGTTLRIALANSTTFRSRIMYPITLTDQPLVELLDRPAPGLVNRALYALGLGRSDDRLTPAVFDYLASLRSDGGHS